ncbi:MAG: CDP-glycerol glycerophosphotransferase family protein [Clostridiales Family XIII bacterium]|jgi:CDP-ribitol ribitolphosphotransferase|nr:CDP-glycerol glycerophosphotransferase family protein [Clostridiales Family XIII bacterium]
MKCAVGLLRVVYAPIKLFPRRQKILLISSQGDEPSRDILMLAGELKNLSEGTEVKVISGRMRRSILGAFSFSIHILKELYHISTSQKVILEGYCVSISAVQHKKGLRVLQMWHAPDAIKKFSRQILDKSAGQSSEVANIMGMHRNYDEVLCPAPAVAPFFCEAFGVGEDKLVYLGIPRIDYISEISRSRDGGSGTEPIGVKARIVDKYPAVSERPTVLYAPTFRGSRPVDVQSLLRFIDFEKVNLVLKLHPLDDSAVGFTVPKLHESRFIRDNEFSSDEWFSVADAIITDYSGIAIEAAVARIPTYFYIYDIEQYICEGGLNIDPRQEAIAPYVFEDGAKLAEALDPQAYDLDLLKAFREKYLSCPDTGNTERLAHYIITNL